MLVDDTDGAPDISLELCGGGVDAIPEVDLVGQPWEDGQECLDGGVGTSRSKVLKCFVGHYFSTLEQMTAYRKRKRNNTREDVGTSTSGLPADGTAPIVSRTVRRISILPEIGPRER